MKIISKFHDYYDVVRAYDTDPKPLWIRETKIIEGEWSAWWSRHGSDRLSRAVRNGTMIPFTIYFCGKRYNGMKDLRGDKPAFHYQPDELLPLCDTAWSRHALAEQMTVKEIDVEWFRANKTPVILYRPSSTTIHYCKELNPRLNVWGFQKVFDPYTAYQELDMYLSNQLADQQDPVPQRTQELIRDAHGFDDWSFKKKVR